MDIVYLVKNCQEDEELTYSLRSLVNIPHDKVFIVGGCPENIDKSKIVHIPTLQIGNKYKNTTNGLKLVCKNCNLSEEFILMNDDFFILKNISSPLKELNLYRGTIKEVLEEMRKRNNTDGLYMTSMRQTDIYLQDIGIKNPLSYELHIPMVMNKSKFLRLFSLPYITDAQLIHKRSIYGNLFLKNSQKTGDVKVYRDFNVIIGSNTFLSTEDISFPKIKNDLYNLFPNKSEFEF